MDTLPTSRRIAVISGATGYVGFEVAKALASNGMRIAVLYHTKPKEIVDKMVSELEGDGHAAYACDISDEGTITQVLEMIEKEMGDIYASVHAAVMPPKMKQLLLTPSSDMREQFETDVFGSFVFLSACALRLKERKAGVLIGITTAGVATENNTKSRGAYTVAKFALQGMLTAFKEELKAHGVRVYSVAPGFMEGGVNSGIPHAFAEMVRHISPTKTITNATEVAEKIAYLCSDDSAYVTALTILMAPETGIS